MSATKVLVLGATGMLGHKLMQRLPETCEVVGTVRGTAAAYAGHPVLGQAALMGQVSAEDFDSVVRAVATSRPDAIVNCIGIVKQLAAASDPLACIGLNALFPHRLAALAQAAGIRLLHISTDCVFSGRRGHYREDDESDATDLYGRAKFLGEVSGSSCVTLRTSMIGRELAGQTGLVEWLVSQRGRTVRGYTTAIFSGLTTLELGRVIELVLTRCPDLAGLWHVAAEPIAKYDLLRLIDAAFGLGVTVEPDGSVVCDRSLDGSRFAAATGYVTPAWPDMIAHMAQNTAIYDRLRAGA